MMRLKLLLPVMLAVALSGCVAAYTLVPPQTATVSKATMSVTPASSWNRAPASVGMSANGALNGKAEVWTLDGPALNQITFFGAIKDGEALIKAAPGAQTKPPLFKSSMLPQEVVEFVEKSYRVLTGSPVFQVSDVRPAQFGGEQGFRFDFSFTTQDEVRRKGRAVGTIRNGQLYLMVYEAAAIHYFDRNLAEFDSMAQGAKIS